MLSVGVAIKLGVRPSEVLQWPLEELALVAAYCELEAESMKTNAAPASTPGVPGTRTVIETQTFVAGAPAPKRK